MIPKEIRAVPAIAVTLILAALSMQAFTLSSLMTLQLLMLLHAVYFWTVFRASLFPAWLAFLLGFCTDLISGNLLGLNAFLLVIASLLIGKQRRYLLSQSFATQWAGFFAVSFAAEAARWGIVSLTAWTLFPVLPALTSAMCNAAIYPLTAFVMSVCLRLISPRKAHEGINHG